MMTESGNTVATGSWTMGELLSLSWQRFRETWWTLVATNLITMALSAVPLMIWMIFSFTALIALADRPGDPSPSVIWGFAGSMGGALMAAMVVMAALSPAQLRITLAAAAGQRPRIGDLFRDFSGALRLYLLGLVTALLVLLAAIPLIIPAIIVALGLTLAPYFLVDAKLSVRAAISASWQAMRGHKLRWWGLMILLGLAQLVVTLILEITIVLSPVALAISIASTPFFTLLTSVLYLRLQPRPLPAALPAAAA
jgi:hypothetical protein